MPRILVADDNTNIQKMVSLAFQDRGVEVISVGNGEAAVRRVPDLNPDLILADIFMPVRNGYEVCEWIKKDPKYAHIPVILLVGAFDPLDEKEARRVGADGILKKPFIPPDPLIAMVTATLEKNPKLAAELGKAKQAIEEPVAAPVHVAPPPPAAQKVKAQIPAPIEVAAVVDDSADDASLAYGFGAGHRDIDTNGQDEPAAARAPKSEFEKAEEEFDGASTTSDWRRSAMSFEVSEEDARRPAFSDEDLESAPIETAAENIVEPIVESMPAIEPLPGAIIDTTFEAEPAPLTEADLKAPDSWQILPDDAAGVAEGDQHSEWASDVPDVSSTPYPQAASESSTASHDQPAAAVAKIASEVVSEPEHIEAVHEAAASRPTQEPAPAESVSPQPSFAAKASHWMDAMGSASGQPQADWLSIIHSQQNRTSQHAEPATVPAVSLTEASETTPGKPDEEASSSSASSTASEHAESESAQHAAQGVSSASVEISEPVISGPVHAASSAAPVTQHVELHNDESVSQEEEDWFFAEDAPQSAAHSEPAVSAVASSSSEAAKEGAAPQDNAFEATVSEPVAVAPSHEDTDFVEQETSAPIASHDSELIEPPAVRVTPEPLLVDEYSPKPSDRRYGDTDQEIAPAYTFLPTVEKSVNSASSGPEQDREESVLPSFGEPQHSADAMQASASPSDEEAVPSYVPPPTREQLAHIPFLNPPPDIEAEAEKAPDSGVAQFAVDAVVQRILEQIEPRLHDLLAQNLKPLIENLVHTEIQKNDH